MAKESNTDLARYEFKRALEELARAKGRGTEMVTVYVPASKVISDVANYLRGEYAQSTNIKSTSTRKNVTGAISSILSELKHFGNVAPDSGIAIFVGAKAVGADKTRMVKHVVLPPEPVTSFLYRCDSQFYLEPLEKMLHDKETYGLLVVDRQEATIGFLHGERIDAVKNMESMVPRKHTMGGQSQRRLERLIEEAAENWFKNVGEKATEIFMAKSVKGLLIGGPGYTKTYFAEGGFMHHELQKKIINTFDTGYTDEYGLKELVQNAQETLREMGLTRERDILGRFLREIVKEGGQVAYGEPQVRHALSIGAVDTLLLSETLRRSRATIKCDGCGHEENRTTGDLDKLAAELDRCPQCNSPSYSIADSRDIVDELSELASNTGSKVMIVSDDTEEGKNFVNAFGGIGALLRFRVQ
ncbi:MAG TPA: peptide chain release factor aRF-1 [Candidatus Thermoplasmatota archaeon]|nr:peptide chain release factor aRF-1 [Candidatus Thermoplasmatota archaeon]